MLYLEGCNFRSRREGAGRGKEERKVNMIVAAGSIWHMIGPGRREVQKLGGCPSEGGWRGIHPPLLYQDSMANAAGLAVQGSGEGPGTPSALEDAGNGRQSELSWSQNPRWAGGLM